MFKTGIQLKKFAILYFNFSELIHQKYKKINIGKDKRSHPAKIEIVENLNRKFLRVIFYALHDGFNFNLI